MDRRTTIKWVLAASTVLPSLGGRSSRAESQPPLNVQGYGTDPDLLKSYRPGDLWPLTFTEAQRRTASSLSDLILPADAHSPSAAALGVVEFIDEWVSAPYPTHQENRRMILDGLAWVDAESARLYQREFSALTASEQRAICDPVCDVSTPALGLRSVAVFFRLYRDLTAGGFYSTPEGRKDLGYMGNVPLAHFDGPPAAVLALLDLDSE